MSSSNGKAIIYSVFGESHGTGIGCSLDGLPAGLALDVEFVRSQLARRRPGSSRFATKRDEADEPEFLSGLADGKTSGGPLCIFIRNSDAHSTDYDSDKPRPSHADLPVWYREGGKADMRGGGRFSGRLTAPMVAAGAIARSILRGRGVQVLAHIRQISDVIDVDLPDAYDEDVATRLMAEHIPTVEPARGQAMAARIDEARMAMDSLGGSIEVICYGLGPGYGEPPFGGLEGQLATWLFAVPAVKALEFGLGRDFASARGSRANDPIGIVGAKPLPLENRSGGANGGFSNGREIRCLVSMRPTPSISLPQRTVSLSEGVALEHVIKGRHDPCVVPRAVPVLESAMALCLLDIICQREGKEWMR